MVTTGNLFVRGLNESVLENFREYVRMKYGKLHTVFGQEVEKALREYLDRKGGSPSQGTRAHTHEKEEIPESYISS